MKHHLNIVFMGTPNFAVASLKAIVEEGYRVSAVVTAPDKPAGRGLKLRYSPVKDYAMSKGIKVLQPTNLKCPDFLEVLKNLKPDVQVVVAFRMLPETIWLLPEKGTFNLHASLLPQYRGAAPINWAIINGESITGLTTFFLNKEIDKGNIIFREPLAIFPDDTAGTLHDRMKTKGALLVLKTLDAIENGTVKSISQDTVETENEPLKNAPKIYKDDCLINWKQPSLAVHNLVRGLSPHPGAFTYLVNPNQKTYLVKIFNSGIISEASKPGEIKTDGKTYLRIGTLDYFLDIAKLQLEGKKIMDIEVFLRGFAISNQWKTLVDPHKNPLKASESS